MKHVLFKNKQEHWKWCYDNYFRYYGDIDPAVWLPEDEEKMQPFFDWQRANNGKPGLMPDDVKKAFDHYVKVSESGMDSRERIDLIQRIDKDQLLGMFGFKRKYESDFETDEEHEEYLETMFVDSAEPELDFELSYPCIMVCSLTATFDRIGDVTEVVIDYVELKEFYTSQEAEKLRLDKRLADREKPNLDEVEFGTPHLKED